MTCSNQLRSFVRLPIAASATLFIMLATMQVQAQTYTVLYRFSGGAGGKNPDVGLSMDRAGNLYGTTLEGGISAGDCARNEGCGTVFELEHQGTGWILAPSLSVPRPSRRRGFAT